MPPPIIPKWSGLQPDFSDWRNNMVDAMEGDGDKSGLTSASLLLGVAHCYWASPRTCTTAKRPASSSRSSCASPTPVAPRPGLP